MNQFLNLSEKKSFKLLEHTITYTGKEKTGIKFSIQQLKLEHTWKMFRSSERKNNVNLKFYSWASDQQRIFKISRKSIAEYIDRIIILCF